MAKVENLTRPPLEQKLIEIDKKTFTDDLLNQMMKSELVEELKKRGVHEIQLTKPQKPWRYRK